MRTGWPVGRFQYDIQDEHTRQRQAQIRIHSAFHGWAGTNSAQWTPPRYPHTSPIWWTSDCAETRSAFRFARHSRSWCIRSRAICLSITRNIPDCRTVEFILTEFEHAGFKNLILITDQRYKSMKNLEAYIAMGQKIITSVKVTGSNMIKADKYKVNLYYNPFKRARARPSVTFRMRSTIALIFRRIGQSSSDRKCLGLRRLIVTQTSENHGHTDVQQRA